MLVYVVTMKRWGDEESHNYVVGVFLTEDEAYSAGEVEKSYRGFKYEPFVTRHLLGELE